MFKIGTLADWFGVGLLEGIRESERCGATGVQIYAWSELNPLTITAEELKRIKKTAVDCHQEITALCGELGGHGLEIAKDNGKKLEYLKRTVDVALELDCNVVTTHIGRVPEDKTVERYAILKEACIQIGEYAASQGAFIAVETGPEKVVTLKSFIDDCGIKGLAINYDPANLVMVTRDDEVAGVYTAGDTIVHTHAKDGRCNKYIGPEAVYEIFAQGNIETLAAENLFTELPLGQGDVRWYEYLTALKEVGYNGYLTIEREVSANATADIRLAVKFLQNMIEKYNF